MKKSKIMTLLGTAFLCTALVFGTIPAAGTRVFAAPEDGESSTDTDSGATGSWTNHDAEDSKEEDTDPITDSESANDDTSTYETTRGSANGNTTATPEENKAPADGTEYRETIHIATVDDFRELATGSHVSSWSEGKLFILDNDLDLAGAPIRVASFRGTFDGQNHKIRGFTVDTSASCAGLFEVIENGGLVENLSVEGSNRPQGTQNQIGGICGINKGTISNCSFKGTVDAQAQVGGICGRNEKTGIVIACSVEGEATGKTYVGGIAGYNAGTIRSAVNKMSVNTTYDDTQVTTDTISDTIETIVTTGDVDTNESVNAETDSGGIAGYSSGIIESSSNEGNVGYDHVGYNIGGVVGRSSGYLADCSNTGTIKGRKDIGGIVGQLQPYLRLDFDKGALGELDRELDALKSAISVMLNDLDGANSATTSSLNRLSDLTGTTSSTVKSIADQTTEDANDAAERINQAEDVLTDVLDGISDSVSKLKSYLSGVSSSTSAAKNSLDQYLKELDLTPEQEQQLSDLYTKMDETQKQLDEDLAALEEETAKEDPDVTKIAELTKKTEEEMTEISQYSSQIAEILGKAVESMPELRDSAFYKDALNLVSEVSSLKSIGEDLESKVQRYDSERKALDLKLRGVNEKVTSSGEDLYTNVGEIGTEVQKLTNSVSGSTTTTVNDARVISDAADELARTLQDAADEATSDSTDEENVRDASDEEDYTDLVQGRATRCTNRGEIIADNNVGGVSGTVGVEYDLDPEKDIQQVGDTSLNYVFSARAVLDGCINYGKVTSKNNYTGGIAGRMDLGLVDEGENYGRIVGGSDYAGGIAGYSVGTIENCFSKCDVSGKKYVGGIVGYGSKIKNNRAMVTISSSEQYVGAIAGRVEDVDSGVVGNVFVGDDLYGVDGVTYDDVAEDTTYEVLGTFENMPAEYNTIHVTFMADDKTVDVADVTYGGTVADADIPAVPFKDGFDGRWDRDDYSNIIQDTVVKAVYARKLDSIAAEKKRDGADLLIVTGSFVEGDVLGLTEETPEQDETERWTVTVPQDAVDESAEVSSAEDSAEENASAAAAENAGETESVDGNIHTFRYLAPDKETDNTTLYLLNADGSRTELKTGTNGRYITFEASGNEFTFSAKTEDAASILGKVAVIGGGAAAVLIALLLVHIVRKKNRKNRKKRSA